MRILKWWAHWATPNGLVKSPERKVARYQVGS
jgi:hypothetical protein